MATQAQLCGQLRVELATLEGLVGPLEGMVASFVGSEDASRILEEFMGYMRACREALEAKIAAYQASYPGATVAAQEYASSRARTSLYIERNAALVGQIEDGWSTMDSFLTWVGMTIDEILVPITQGPNILVDGMKDALTATKDEIHSIVQEVVDPVKTTAVGAGILILILMVVGAIFAYKELR